MKTFNEAVAKTGVIQTFSGRYVRPLDLEPETIVIEDIAHALANQCRYSGHTKKFYSVGQHCVLAVRVARTMLRIGHEVEKLFAILMHDSPEAYLQDVARPLKEEPYFGQAYRGAEGRAEKVLAEVFGFTYPFPPEVKLVDLMMLGAEKRDLMPPGPDWEILEGIEIPEFEIIPWTPERTEAEFLKLYEKLQARR